MKLTEEQLKQLVLESAKKVVLEYEYHERQHEPSEEEHAEWIKRKAAAKRRYYDSQKKDDDKPIDHYEYKHGKGDFPIMTKESTVRMSSSDFHKFITESVKGVLKEMGLKGYDAWRTKTPDYFSPNMVSEDDFWDVFYNENEKELLDWLKSYRPDVYKEAIRAEQEGTENAHNVAYERLGWKEIAREFLDMKPVKYYPGDNDPDPRDARGLDEEKNTVGCCEELDGGEKYQPKSVWVDSRVKGVGSSWYYGGHDQMHLDELQDFLDKSNAVAVYGGEFYDNVYDIPFKPARHSIDTFGMPTGRYTESEPSVTVVPKGTEWEEQLYSTSRRYKFPEGFSNDFDYRKEQKPDRDWRKNK